MGNIDPSALFSSMHAAANAVISLFGMLGVVAGVALLMKVAKHLTKGDSRTGEVNWASVGTSTLVATLMFQFATSVNWMMDLTAGTGTGVREAMAYTPGGQGGGGSFWSLVMAAVMAWLACIGVMGIYRGFLLFNKAGSGDSQGGGGDPFWAAVWHCLGGAILINIGT